MANGWFGETTTSFAIAGASPSNSRRWLIISFYDHANRMITSDGYGPTFPQNHKEWSAALMGGCHIKLYQLVAQHHFKRSICLINTSKIDRCGRHERIDLIQCHLSACCKVRTRHATMVHKPSSDSNYDCLPWLLAEALISGWIPSPLLNYHWAFRMVKPVAQLIGFHQF